MALTNIGLIGLGGMSNHHLRLLAKLDHVQIAALCDVNESAIRLVGEKYGVSEERRYADYESLIKDSKVDAVISMVPNRFHAEIIQYCLRYRKPLMTEKPFTLTFEEAKNLVDLYRSAPTACMVGFSYRYIPSFRYVKQLLEDEKLGKIRHISVQYLQEWGSPLFDVPYNWRFSKEMSGSGALGDLGSHMIDTARYYIGEFHSLAGMMKTFVTERELGESQQPVDVDDFTSFQALFESGVIGTFITSRNAIGSGNQLEVTVYGDLGTARVCCEQPDEVHLCLKSEHEKNVPFVKITVPKEFYRNQLQDFIDFISDPTLKDVPTFYDGYENQKVIQGIIDSSETGKLIVIDHSEK